MEEISKGKGMEPESPNSFYPRCWHTWIVHGRNRIAAAKRGKKMNSD